MSHPLHELTKDQSALLRARLHALKTSVESIGAVDGVATSALQDKINEVVATIEALSADLEPGKGSAAPDSDASMHAQSNARARSEVASGEIDMQG